jgi:hypothetical protein
LYSSLPSLPLCSLRSLRLNHSDPTGIDITLAISLRFPANEACGQSSIVFVYC